MVTFSRALWVGGEFLDEERLRFHGMLEDHIYAMEIQADVRISDGTIVKIQGRMKRYTTPVCPQAEGLLQQVVGLSLRQEGWIGKINREIGRKGCQHFAEILIECGRCLDAALLGRAAGEAQRKGLPGSAEALARSWVESRPEIQGTCLARPLAKGAHAR